MKVIVTTASFAEKDNTSLLLLKKYFNDIYINPYGRKLKSDEIKKQIKDADIVIAGTEDLSEEVLKSAMKLKHISRVGVGYDNIDLKFASKNNIKISITPNAPSYAVAEFTFAMILNKVRNIDETNIKLHNSKWLRKIGNTMRSSTIGIIGYGRIGKILSRLLINFGIKNLYVYDPYISNAYKNKNKRIVFSSKNKLLKESDIVSLHLPLNKNTKNIIAMKEFKIMKNNSNLVNTSRGGLVNEKDLFVALKKKIIAGAALDVYKDEPYKGSLIKLDNCLLTSHLSPMTIESRKQMEYEAVNEAIRFYKNRKLKNCINK